MSQPYDEQLAGPPADTSVEVDQEDREPLTATDEPGEETDQPEPTEESEPADEAEPAEETDEPEPTEESEPAEADPLEEFRRTLR